MRYPQLHSGDWVEPLMSNWRIQCCDCGLVHDLKFKHHGRGIKVRVTLNNRATAAARRKKNPPTTTPN